MKGKAGCMTFGCNVTCQISTEYSLNIVIFNVILFHDALFVKNLINALQYQIYQNGLCFTIRIYTLPHILNAIKTPI